MIDLSQPMRKIWFWERIISPHNSWFLVELARQGSEVVYVTEQVLSADRVEQGWSPPPLQGVRSALVLSRLDVDHLIAQASNDSVHICDGIRSNRLVGYAQQKLAQRGLRQWVVMETVDDAGWVGLLKRCEYRRLFWLRRNRLEGVLTTGYNTNQWVIDRGVKDHKVFPFAYFLQSQDVASTPQVNQNRPFRFLFVGQFIERKRLDFFIFALSKLQNTNFELVVVGSGPLESELRQLAETILSGRVIWVGKLPIDNVQEEMARADCLVLPSRHDGWGAVVSEAMMVGTQVICSDRCGAAGVVHASGHGGVFSTENLDDLTSELNRVLTKGRLSTHERVFLIRWAECLGAAAGANYLLKILDHIDGVAARPAPPWDGQNKFINPENRDQL